MNYEVLQAPENELLALEDVKVHLRTIAGDTAEDDAVLAPLITAAREYCENVTGLALAQKTIAAYPETFETAMRLPVAPADAVTAIYINDDASLRAEVDAGNYQLTADGTLYISAIPQFTPRAVRPIEIIYQAGYEKLPMLIRQAELLLIGHWYINRETVITGSTTAVEVPLAARTILNQYKRWWC